MRVFRVFGRSIATSFRSIFRNFSLSMASITCTMITLILVSLGILMAYNLNNIGKNLENEVTIVVFMNKDVTAEELVETESYLKTIDNILEVTFKSKDEIKEEMAATSEDMANILNSWDEGVNPLLDSYIIHVEDVRDIDETATTIRNMELVETVRYGATIANDLIKTLTVVQNASIALVIALVLVSTFLIGNTIKITIFSRRNEIEIMRLVGTSNAVIRLPFFFEGLILGIFGSIIPILITIFGYDYLYQFVNNNSSFSSIFRVLELIPPVDIVFTTSLILLAIAAIVSMFGSLKAVRKYLKV